MTEVGGRRWSAEPTEVPTYRLLDAPCCVIAVFPATTDGSANIEEELSSVKVGTADEWGSLVADASAHGADNGLTYLLGSGGTGNLLAFDPTAGFELRLPFDEGPCTLLRVVGEPAAQPQISCSLPQGETTGPLPSLEEIATEVSDAEWSSFVLGQLSP